MAVKTFTTEVLTSADTNTYLANSGLVYVASTSFSGATSATINNCFTATYTNYLVVIEASASTAGFPLLRMRVSGTDSTVSYNFAGYYISMSAPALTAEGATSQSGMRLGAWGSFPYGASTTLFQPSAAAKTTYTCLTQSAELFTRYFGGYHDVATAYSGCTLVPSAGTMTGNIRIYGYRQA
jgi:hypothetical protein